MLWIVTPLEIKTSLSLFFMIVCKCPRHALHDGYLYCDMLTCVDCMYHHPEILISTYHFKTKLANKIKKYQKFLLARQL